MSMRRQGVTYDTGFFNGRRSTHEPFVESLVQREMQIVHDDLHCSAVRVTGGDPDRLETASLHAAAVGLEVWFSPFTCDLSTEELLILLGDCAERAERLRREGAAVVLLTGAELGLFTKGFLPGDTLEERLGLLAQPARLRELAGLVPPRINDFLGRAAKLARERFGGRLSYASLPFEGVDWTPFDFVATDAGYRSTEVARGFRDGIRAFVAQGKPAAITEFGCCTYRGAADRGGRGDAIIEWEGGVPAGLDGDYARAEDEQAQYLLELLGIFEAEGVDTAFVNTFARYDLPHRPNPREDLDLASYGVVKVLEHGSSRTYPGLPWEPKAAFAALAGHFGSRVGGVVDPGGFEPPTL